jgi:fructose transport system substrate-binding protein
MSDRDIPASSRRRLLPLAAAAVGVALIATACSSSGGSSPSSAPGGGGATSSSAGSGVSTGKRVGVTLILKTLTNPYFVSMQKDAAAAAKKDNVSLTVAAGKQDGDTQSQINAVQNAISRGDKGILITTNGDAVNASLRQAKQQGIKVIALDTALNPVNTADATYATDNFQAGKLIGQYGAATVNGKKAVIAMLDLFNNQVVSVDIQRDHGFLTGMGINPGSTTLNGKEAKSGKYSKGDYQIACHQPTQGAVDGGRTAMENCLSANPDINVVYAINEPAAEGAYNALKAAGKQSGVTVRAIDGSCSGVGFVQSGEFAADSAQYPGLMASKGVDTIASVARGGSVPKPPAGQAFVNTGTNLITNSPIAGITSQTPAQGKAACWGSA